MSTPPEDSFELYKQLCDGKITQEEFDTAIKILLEQSRFRDRVIRHAYSKKPENGSEIGKQNAFFGG